MAEVVRSQSPLASLAQWLDLAWPSGGEMTGAAVVRLEDEAKDDKYVVRAELPGLDPEKDVSVSVSDGILTIRGERRSEKKEGKRSEFYYGSFSRSMTLPKNVTEEDISAQYKDGILEVSFPLKSPESKSRTVQIERA